MHSNFKTALRNVEQKLQSGRLQSLGNSNGTNHEFTVRGNSQGNSNPFQGIIQPFRDISRDVLWSFKLPHEEEKFITRCFFKFERGNCWSSRILNVTLNFCSGSV